MGMQIEKFMHFENLNVAFFNKKITTPMKKAQKVTD